MNDNSIGNSTNSQWQYNFGEGYSRVHVEETSDNISIELQNETVWESIVNFFLNLADQKPNKPNIVRQVTLPTNKDNISTKINEIKNNISRFEKEGLSPSGIITKLAISQMIKGNASQPSGQTSKENTTDSSSLSQRQVNKTPSGSPQSPVGIISQTFQESVDKSKEKSKGDTSNSSEEGEADTFTDQHPADQQKSAFSTTTSESTEPKSKDNIILQPIPDTASTRSSESASKNESKTIAQSPSNAISQPTKQFAEGPEKNNFSESVSDKQVSHSQESADTTTHQNIEQENIKEDDLFSIFRADSDSIRTEEPDEVSNINEENEPSVQTDQTMETSGQSSIEEVESPSLEAIIEDKVETEPEIKSEVEAKTEEAAQTFDEAKNTAEPELETNNAEVIEAEAVTKTEAVAETKEIIELEPEASAEEAAQTLDKDVVDKAMSDHSIESEDEVEDANETLNQIENEAEAIETKAVAETDEVIDFEAKAGEEIQTLDQAEEDLDQAALDKFLSDYYKAKSAPSIASEGEVEMANEFETGDGEDEILGKIEEKEGEAEDVINTAETVMAEEAIEAPNEIKTEEIAEPEVEAVAEKVLEPEAEAITEDTAEPEVKAEDIIELEDETLKKDVVEPEEDAAKPETETKTKDAPEPEGEPETEIAAETINGIKIEDITVVPNPLFNPTQPAELSKADSTVNKFMRFVGYGLITGVVVVVGVGLSIALSGGMMAFLARRGATDTTTGPAYPTDQGTALSLRLFRENLDEVSQNLGNTHAGLSKRCSDLSRTLQDLQDGLKPTSSQADLVKIAFEIQIASQQFEEFFTDINDQKEQGLTQVRNSPVPNNNNLFAQMSGIAASSPEMVEELLLKILGTENKSLRLPENFNPGQEFYFVDVAEKLFQSKKGEAIVKKVLELYTSPDIDSADYIFLQQILETAIDKGFCIDQIKDAMLKYAVTIKWKPQKERTGIKDLSLNRLVERINSKYNLLSGLDFYTKTDDIEDAVWAFKSSRDDENILLNILGEKNADLSRNLGRIDRKVADSIFSKSSYGAKTNDDDRIEIAHALFLNDSGHEVLRAILERISRDDDKKGILRPLVVDAIKHSPKVITDLLLSPGDFSNKILLRKILLEVSGTEYFDKVIDGLMRLNPNEITSDNMQNLQELGFNYMTEDLQKDKLTRDFFNYKSDENALQDTYNGISKAIAIGTNLDEIDGMLAQLLTDNRASPLPNQEIFKEDSPASIYKLIQQLGEKGAAKSTIASLTQSLVDPNLNHLAKAQINLLKNIIKQSSAETVNQINNDLAISLYERFSHFNAQRRLTKEFLDSKIHESNIGIDEVLIASLNRYNELGVTIDENFFYYKNNLIKTAIQEYRFLTLQGVSKVKNPLCIQLVNSCIDLLPKESIKPFAEFLGSRVIIHTEENVLPGFYEIYKKIGEKAGEEASAPLLYCAKANYKHSNPETQKEFDKIIKWREEQELMRVQRVQQEQELTQILNTAEPNINDLFAKMSGIAAFSPERAEESLLKMFETENKSLLLPKNFNPGQKVYFVDVAGKLFKSNKGESIVRKALDLYFSPDINQEEVIFLQQILETAIEKDFCIDQIKEALQEHVVSAVKQSQQSVKAYMWQPEQKKRYNRFDTENLSLRRLADQINAKQDNIMSSLTEHYIDTDAVEKAVWDFKTARGNENELYDTIREKDAKDLDLIDREIAKQIFQPNLYGEKTIDEEFIEILDILFLKDSGHEVLRSILERISKGDNGHLLVGLAIQDSPKLITDIFFQSDRLTDKILLRKIISDFTPNTPGMFREKVINRLIDYADSNEISSDNLLNLQELVKNMPEDSLKNLLTKKLSALQPLEKHFYNYKSHPETSIDSYNAISNAIVEGTNLDEIDEFLGRVLIDNLEGALPNSQIFDETNPSNVYQLIQQLVDKGSGKFLIQHLTSSFIDPNLGHVSHAHFNLLNNMIKRGSQELVTKISQDLGSSIYSRFSFFSPSKAQDKQFLALKQYESTLGIDKLLITILNRYNELGFKMDLDFLTRDHLITNAIFEYKDLNVLALKEVKKPLCVEILKSCVDLLPRELMDFFAKRLIWSRTYLINEESVLPDFHEIYEKMGKDGNELLLNFALSNYKYAGPETREEFNKVILSAGRSLPEG